MKKALVSFALFEFVCFVIADSPLRSDVAIISGQHIEGTYAAFGGALVVAAQMLWVAFVPIAIIACILHHLLRRFALGKKDWKLPAL